LFETQLRIERNRRLVVVPDIQDHLSHVKLPHDIQAGPNQVGTDATAPAARLHYEAMEIGQLTSGTERDYANRVLRSCDQDRAMFAEQLTSPAALAPLLCSRNARLLHDHDGIKIIKTGRQDADLGVAGGFDHRAAP
jgi:hypothetical protein